MASQIEILLKAKNDTDAAFKAVLKHLDATGQEAKKTNKILGDLAADLKGKLGGAASDLTGKLGPLGSSLSALGPVGLAAGAALGALVGIFAAAAKVSIDAATAAAKYGDDMAALADRTGLSTDALQSFEVAAKLGNSTIEAVAAGVNKMQLAMVNGSTAFKKLGLDINALKAMEPDKAFVQVAKAIESINDPAERAAARVAVFGKAGNELAGTLKAAAQGAGDLGAALSGKALEASAALQDKADLMAKAWERVQLQFGAAIAQSPELQRGIEDITDALVKFAQTIADATPDIVSFFDKLVAGVRLAIVAFREFGSLDYLEKIKLAGQEIAMDAEDAAERAKIAARQLNFERQHLVEEDVRFTGAGEDAKAKAIEAAAERARKAWQAASEKARAEWDKFTENIKSRSGDWASDNQKQIDEWAKKFADATIKAAADYNAMVEAQIDDGERLASELSEQNRRIWEEQIDLMFQAGDAAIRFGQILGGTFGDLISIAGNLLNSITSIRVSLDQIQAPGAGLLDKIVGGLGIAGTAIGAVKGLFNAIFGGAKKAREEMEKLRAEFLKSQGGMAALQAKAKEAGIALDRMFNAKNAQQLSSAIAQIKDQLDTWEQAQQDLADAMERYGLTVDQMGPRFAQQQLDQQAAQLIKDFALLTQAGADVVVVTQAMADEMNAYVQSVIKSGSTIPESMRPMLQRMLDMGLLTNEGGEAFKSFEEAGITFSQTMSEQFSNLMAQIQKLVEALARGFHVPVSFDFTSTGNPPEPVPPGGNPHFPEGAGGFVGTFPNSGGMAMLHGQEAVVPLSDPAAMRALGEAIASAMHASGGGGSAVPVIHNIIELDGRALDTRTSRRMRQRGIRLPDQQRGRM